MGSTMTTRKINDMARNHALADLREIHPKLWEQIYDECRKEAEQKWPFGTPRRGDQVAQYSRYHGRKRLQEAKPGHWRVLLDGWREQIQREAGYVDARAEANRKRFGKC
jgi:hypothetical protein